jgi:hypothetical protein
MLIAVERLLLKIRQPRSRAGELIELRRRVRAELAASPSADEVRLAAEIRTRKLAVTAALTDVRSCRSCARGAPLPRGRYDGGDCCAGVTNDLFDDRELAALVHAGTRVADLTPPRDDHAGCTFRGAHGCSLELEHRPARCVHYVCNTLRRELHGRGQLDEIESRLAALSTAMGEFTAAHKERTDRDVLAPLIDALERHQK